MIHKMIKLLMGLVMLAAMTGVYASNTGVIKVTNKCDSTHRDVVVWSKPSGLSCWGVSGIKRIGGGKSATFEDLNTECDYSVTGVAGEIFSVNLKSDGISYAHLVDGVEGLTHEIIEFNRKHGIDPRCNAYIAESH